MRKSNFLPIMSSPLKCADQGLDVAAPGSSFDRNATRKEMAAIGSTPLPELLNARQLGARGKARQCAHFRGATPGPDSSPELRVRKPMRAQIPTRLHHD